MIVQQARYLTKLVPQSLRVRRSRQEVQPWHCKRGLCPGHTSTDNKGSRRSATSETTSLTQARYLTDFVPQSQHVCRSPQEVQAWALQVRTLALATHALTKRQEEDQQTMKQHCCTSKVLTRFVPQFLHGCRSPQEVQAWALS